VGRHTLSVLVENKPGVLARVAALFARRRYNIDSLNVEPMEHVQLSRMTIVVDIGDLHIDQVVSQIDKLVNVLEVEETEAADAAAGRPLHITRADAA
jgi:acetolactate synthase-1/3 small subunit